MSQRSRQRVIVSSGARITTTDCSQASVVPELHTHTHTESLDIIVPLRGARAAAARPKANSLAVGKGEARSIGQKTDSLGRVNPGQWTMGDDAGHKLSNNDGPISQNIVCYCPGLSAISRVSTVGQTVGQSHARAVNGKTGQACEAGPVWRWRRAVAGSFDLRREALDAALPDQRARQMDGPREGRGGAACARPRARPPRTGGARGWYRPAGGRPSAARRTAAGAGGYHHIPGSRQSCDRHPRVRLERRACPTMASLDRRGGLDPWQPPRGRDRY